MSRHLMAKMRRTAIKLDFPWQLHEHDDDCGHEDHRNETWEARLENGHRLSVFETTQNDPHWDELEPGSHQYGTVPADAPQSHWKGGYHLGLDHPDVGDPEAHEAAGWPDDWSAPWKAVYNPRSTLRAKAYPSREKALLAVEREYKKHIRNHMLTNRTPAPKPPSRPSESPGFDDYDYGDFGGMLGGGR